MKNEELDPDWMIDHDRRYKAAKKAYPNEDPIHVMILDKKPEVDKEKIFAERDAFYRYREVLGEYGFMGEQSTLPDGGPKYWCGGMGCMSDAEISYVEKQVAKGISFVELLKNYE
jgi:hypothetical protein